MAQAFPLQWPAGVPRCMRPQKASFGTHTVSEGITDLRRQVMLLGSRTLTISTNIPLRQDGLPYSNPGRMQDPGVACYFRLDNTDYCLPCDKWQTVEHNLWAVAKHIDAMRGMRRWGVGTTHQAFAGYKALTATATARPWWEVLGTTEHASRQHIEDQYRQLARQLHPDTGGSHDAMAELNRAREEALKHVTT